MRTFLAIDIDEDIRRRLASCAEKLSSPDAKIRWVAPANLHVTLKFLGDVCDELSADVCNVTSEIAAEVERFEFRVRGVQVVPPSGRVRMFWAGVDEPTGQMALLHDRLDAAMGGLGFKREDRAYKAHITLGRVKHARDWQRLRVAGMAMEAEDFGACLAECVTVYASELAPSGPVYTPISHAPLSA